MKCDGDTQRLQIPQSLNKLVSTFIDTYSGVYMNAREAIKSHNQLNL